MLGLVYGAAGPARAAKLYPACEHNTHTEIVLINFKLEIDFVSESGATEENFTCTFNFI